MENQEKIESRRVELVKIVEAFENLEQSEEWSTLKELVFDKSLASIERQILNESISPEINTNNLYRLQGEWSWAKRYNDVNRFIESCRKELADIKTKQK